MSFKSAGLAGAVAALVLAGQAQAERVCDNRTGVHDGYFYTLWKDQGAACLDLAPGGGYGVAWSLAGRGNLVAGKGWAAGSPARIVGYHARLFDPGSNGYLTLYGWSTEPLVEYYVVDGWGGFTPPGPDAQPLGTVASDGGVYNIYRTRRVDAPSIRGTRTFDQYWSVRTVRRPLGQDNHITFANHVAAWRRLGMELGTLGYQVMATEGFGSRGASDLTVWQAPDRP